MLIQNKNIYMKLLVIGADGLVGSAIRRLNNPNTIYVTRKDGDLTDFAQTKAIFEEHRPTHVINVAAQVGGIGANLNHPGTYFRNNLLINSNVMEAARLNNVTKLLTLLSTCIFPDKCEYPLNEADLHSGPPHPTNFAYAHAKRMIDVQSRAYRIEYGCNFITAIGTNIYGPNDNFNLQNSHVLPALIYKCYLAKQNNEDFGIWGSGQPLREFVLSDDIAKLSLWALENYEEESPIIFTSGIETSIKDVVNILVKNMDFKGNVIFDSSKPDGQMRKPSDATKIKKYLPDFEFTLPGKGIEETVGWFLKNYPNIRK